MQRQRGGDAGARGAGGRRRRSASGLAVVLVVAFGLGAVVGPRAEGLLAPAVAGAQASSWSVGTSPSPAGLTANELNAVSCPATGDCVAVGYSSTPLGTSPLIESLGAGGWELAAAPRVPGSRTDALEGVSCASASSCVAVGYYQQKGGAEQALVETLANGTWSVTTSPDGGSGNNQLTSVSCPAPSACVAAGYYDSGGTSRALAEELSGGSWVLMTVPDAGSATDVLNGVSCTSTGSCVAVGYYENAGVQRALVETLSASAWAVTPSQDQGTGLNELSAVSCPSSGSCVSVGTYRTAAGVNQDLIEALVGGTWSVQHPSPDVNARTNELAGVSCSSTTSCMAAGHYNNNGVAQSLTIVLAPHGSWDVVSSPDKGTSTNQFAGVSCPRATTGQCEGVGYFNQVINGYADVAPQALAEAWSGTAWSMVTAADALDPDVAVNDVACPSSTSCTAVGSYESPSGTRQVFIEGLASGTWTTVPGPGPSATANDLDAVSCPSTTSCVAVGYYATTKTDQALVEKFSGAAWSVSPSPDEGTGYNQLNGVSCPSAGGCVAVGFYTAGSAERVLIETLANGSWTLTPSPPLTASSSYLESVSCPSSTLCVAVGYDYNGVGRRTLVEVMADGVWSVARSPNVGTGDNLLDSVSCWSAVACTAVGYYTAGKSHEGLAETLGANGWAVTTIPQPSVSGDYPSGVSCTPTGSCALVGNYASGPRGTVAQTLVETLGTGAWAVVVSPSPDAGGDYLAAVSCVTGASCVAVGHYSAGVAQGSIVEWGPTPIGLASTTTTITASPDPSRTGQQVTYTATVAPAPTGGTVTFADNGAVLAGCRAVAVAAGGKAKCSVTYSVAGENLVQAAYSGRAGFSPSTSGLFSQMVTKPAPLAQGYWLATKTGHVFAAGAARSFGGISTTAANPLVGISTAPGGRGYWVVTANGAVAAFGGATSYGDLPKDNVKASDIVAIAPTANGGGYWLVGRDGGLFAFGDAAFHGSVPEVKKQVSDIVGMVASPGGRGYLLVGSDGGVFAFGASHFYGSLPAEHVKVHDVRAILPSSRGTGYVLVAADGGAFFFGSGVSFHGSLPEERSHVSDIVGIALTPDDGGYFMAGANGSVYGFGDAKVQPAPAGLAGHLPVVAIAGIG
jgi:Bacterial Ig-like domain (group 3)